VIPCHSDPSLSSDVEVNKKDVDEDTAVSDAVHEVGEVRRWDVRRFAGGWERADFRLPEVLADERVFFFFGGGGFLFFFVLEAATGFLSIVCPAGVWEVEVEVDVEETTGRGGGEASVAEGGAPAFAGGGGGGGGHPSFS